MTENQKLRTVAIAAYLACGVITFGHAFNNVDACTLDIINRVERRDTFDRGVLAFFSSLAWPVYVSVTAFENNQFVDCK